MISQFVPMYKILSEGKTKNFELSQRKITKKDVAFAKIREIIHPREIPPKIGTLMVLTRKESILDCVMSDAEYEKITNRTIVRVARGNVLIAGLGLGMILMPLLKNKDVKKITVIEKEQELIDLISPKIKKHDKKNKLQVIQGDINEIELPKEQKFDVIYFDIWDNVCGDNYQQMKDLKKKFSKNRAKGSTVLCWEEKHTRKLDHE